MGKSPGKWIKTVLLGKKSSKSNFSKGREKGGNEKEVRVAAKAQEADLALDPPVATNEKKWGENREAANLSLEKGLLLHGNRDADTQETPQLDAMKDTERIRQEQAATKTQAAFKGYLARRAFRALKGIIRLQALVRGHLVRRQAVSTLRCMLGIVKLQALARGRNVRCSDIGLQAQKKCIFVTPLQSKLADSAGDNTSVKTSQLSVNGFARELLASSHTTVPLRLQYDSAEPNSVLSWLDRWSASFLWKPIPQTKEVPGSKSQKKQGKLQTIDTETGRIKKSIRRNLPSNLDNVTTQSTSEIEKPRRSLRKVSSHPPDSVQEHPQNELEKVKRNLRKVLNPSREGTVQSEADGEKPKNGQMKVLSSSGQNTAEESISNSGEKIKKRASAAVSKLPDIEATLEPLVVNEPSDERIKKGASENMSKLPDLDATPEPSLVVNEAIDSLHDDQTAVESELLDNSGKDESIPVTNEELSSGEDITANESQKSARKASSSTKQERPENGIRNRNVLPSYMVATESAKAKLRAQGSPRLSEDGVEKHNPTRRHSLPASTNGKVVSSSPRPQRPIQMSGKGGNTSDRYLLSSRDGNVKGIQAEWRR
ncbi:protein IQ-DOMAIN 31-like isoform X1 [Actinidia eriantha]|uniref:protein IQ-DOMAIN 31-like isoform X1 n=1 Tax=Actinidia eriantha TaxID=165200 RepID=UPI0025908413|nr:protein IQ-DOMAIN 31-like isoform X1 [Actinidia eriantha]XP_057460235.1 protein IQ-DOMAIN 31-like isoform X1 [Actinidia eriantha]XP_057460236.1 protein IQ-DOMAIN 31-like isoform X1 [Actinidia eriantha]